MKRRGREKDSLPQIEREKQTDRCIDNNSLMRERGERAKEREQVSKVSEGEAVKGKRRNQREPEAGAERYR